MYSPQVSVLVSLSQFVLISPKYPVLFCFPEDRKLQAYFAGYTGEEQFSRDLPLKIGRYFNSELNEIFVTRPIFQFFVVSILFFLFLEMTGVLF